MLIGDKYKVEADRNNLILYVKTVADDTKITKRMSKKVAEDSEIDEQGWRHLGYFYDFRELLRFMVDDDIKGMGLEDLKAISKRQGKLYELIESLKPITPKDIMSGIDKNDTDD